MKLSKKSRYGLKALIDLALNSKSDQVSLSSIAERNGIPQQYLEQIFASLRRAGIIKSVKGPQGGYQLNIPAHRLTLSQIVEALEGSYLLEPEPAGDSGSSGNMSRTIQKLVIDRVNGQMTQILDGLTLADLEKDFLARQCFGEDMYYI